MLNSPLVCRVTLNKGYMRYVDKTKALDYLHLSAPIAEASDNAKLSSAAKIVKDFVNPTILDAENAMADRVTELSEKMHTPVRIVRTEEEITSLPGERQRMAKGSYNTISGEVTVILPNNVDVADVETTVVHEVVGHDGLRVLFPEEEKLNNALDELYGVSAEGIQKTIDGTAQKMYDAEVSRIMERKGKERKAKGEDRNAAYYEDLAAAHKEAGKKREKFKRDATEEYGADLAGRIGESGFEKMSADEITFWGKLKAMLQKALNALLNGLKIDGGKKWTNKEWAYVLHEAYKRKKNGGKPSVVDMADTIVTREKTGFGTEGRGKMDNADEELSEDDIMFRYGNSIEYEQALARDFYERRIGEAMYQMNEAFLDSMAGLKVAIQY